MVVEGQEARAAQALPGAVSAVASILTKRVAALLIITARLKLIRYEIEAAARLGVPFSILCRCLWQVLRLP
jgi:hypothetical protein